MNPLKTSFMVARPRGARSEFEVEDGGRRRAGHGDGESLRTLWFAALCCFIGVVSVHDAYLLLHNRQSIRQDEKNPIGRWLIEVGGGDVLLFVAVKLTTTAAVCSFLVDRYQRRLRHTQWIATGVATFQLGLLLYLMGAWR